MSVEVEAKIKLDSHDSVRRTLTALNAQWISRVIETNYIFDTADRTLLAGGQGLRVRTHREAEGSASPSTMTYKGPLQDSHLKIRQEIETTVGDPAAAINLLKALGFIIAVSFEKRRETWRLQDCSIELDEVPHLGCYVEIEGGDEEQVHRVQDLIGLAGREPIRTSYIALLVDYCNENGLPITDITFTS